MQNAINHLRRRGSAVVAVVGDVSRTAWTDYFMLHDVLSIVVSVNPQALFVRGSRVAFDHVTGCVCAWSGYALHDDSEQRSVALLDGVDLLIGFPRNVFDKSAVHRLDTADREIVEFARKIGTPILGVYRDGSTVWEGPL
jgi:hypothetical protein